MAIQYPQFRKFAHQGLSGKMTINFKDTAALHALSTTLLEKDFNLKVNIPTDRLVPTIPSRLNYILLIEDLLECGGRREGEVHGIDIGTGASCVYSLLAAKTKQWKMLATEVDKESVKFAIENVQRNNLQHLILVKSVSHTVVLKGALEEDHSYDFCMCNPPFFSAESELNPSLKRRSPNRPPPRNGLTGSLQEVMVMGGEVAFIKRMIEESLELKTTIKIYSSLVGHKSSLTPLKNALKQAGVSNMTEVMFCQGHTSRWILAWTFDDKCDLRNVSYISKRKKNLPLTYLIPHPEDIHEYTLPIIATKFQDMFSQLQLEVKILKMDDRSCLFEITALKNTWSYQRKKRRGMKFKANQLLYLPPSSTILCTETKEYTPLDTKQSDNSASEGSINSSILCLNTKQTGNSVSMDRSVSYPSIEYTNNSEGSVNRTMPCPSNSNNSVSMDSSVPCPNTKYTNNSASEVSINGSMPCLSNTHTNNSVSMDSNVASPSIKYTKYIVSEGSINSSLPCLSTQHTNSASEGSLNSSVPCSSTQHINSVSEDSMGISVLCPSIENTNNSASIGSGPCIRRGQKRQGGGAVTMDYKLFKSSDATSCTGILLKAGIALVPVHLDICLELMLLGGSGGQESLHQLLQYFKNNIRR
uniref:(California timema) hypothetical protein n=1 Tax=Timema californicum TaxID=61474 RepID=A0A7R9IZ77_TIMCA|nr:unnamed protein product [Timema californicum]